MLKQWIQLACLYHQTAGNPLVEELVRDDVPVPGLDLRKTCICFSMSSQFLPCMQQLKCLYLMFIYYFVIFVMIIESHLVLVFCISRNKAIEST